MCVACRGRGPAGAGRLCLRSAASADERAVARDAPITHTPFIYVDDLDAHFAHAKARCAEIIQDIHQHGFRAYEAADPEGNRWTFAQASPLMR
jgi:uncharacterized glyoxalase superfamily protein PhnB